jgi:hypothetical protein
MFRRRRLARSRREYELQRAPEFLFERRPYELRCADRKPGQHQFDERESQTVLVVGNQAPYLLTRLDELRLSQADVPALTVTQIHQTVSPWLEVAAHLVYELDPDGKQLRVVRYTDYAAEKVRTLCPTGPELRARWADPQQRSEITEPLLVNGTIVGVLYFFSSESEVFPAAATDLSSKACAERLREQFRSWLGMPT